MRKYKFAQTFKVYTLMSVIVNYELNEYSLPCIFQFSIDRSSRKAIVAYGCRTCVQNGTATVRCIAKFIDHWNIVKIRKSWTRRILILTWGITEVSPRFFQAIWKYITRRFESNEFHSYGPWLTWNSESLDNPALKWRRKEMLNAFKHLWVSSFLMNILRFDPTYFYRIELNFNEGNENDTNWETL